MKSHFFFAMLPVLAFCFLGCAQQTVRYSPDEIKDYPTAIQQSIRQGDVVMGMTTQQVRYALGSPATVNVLAPSLEGKPREDWIYSSSVGFVVKKRLLFVDGKLADIYPESERQQPAEQQAEQPAGQNQDEKK